MKNHNGNTPKTSENYSIEWYTPPEVTAPIIHALGCRPVLDPASNQMANDLLVKADHFLTQEDDGLKVEWANFRNPDKFSWIWCNPPFGTDIVKRFILKAKTSCMPTVMLLPSVTDRGYYQYALDKCDALYLMGRRVTFFRPPRMDKDPVDLWDKDMITKESNTVGSTLFFFNFSITAEYKDLFELKRVIADAFSDEETMINDEQLYARGYKSRSLSWHEGKFLFKH